MCGRVEYVVSKKEILEARYDAKLIEGFADQGFSFPHYNIPPTAHMPLLTSEATEEILVGHWGYVPEWGKADTRAVINARAESILEKPYFKKAALSRRCLLPVTGFFEWKRDEKIKKPFRFHMQGDLFSLAGVYTTKKDEKGFEMPHYAIITTAANELMSPIHDRMPVVIPQESEARWLDEGLEEEEIQAYFKSNPWPGMQRDEISTLVNSPKNDVPEILKKVV